MMLLPLDTNKIAQAKGPTLEKFLNWGNFLAKGSSDPRLFLKRATNRAIRNPPVGFFTAWARSAVNLF